VGPFACLQLPFGKSAKLEIMNMMRKGQLQGVAKGDVRGQVALVAKLFGVAA
jgi:hypothetical protein